VILRRVLKQQLVLYTPPLREARKVYQKLTFLRQPKKFALRVCWRFELCPEAQFPAVPIHRKGSFRLEFFSETGLPVLPFVGNSRLLTQHYDRYLPFGLTLIVGVGWIRLCEARPQP
jgi:hypothetical protein